MNYCQFLNAPACAAKCLQEILKSLNGFHYLYVIAVEIGWIQTVDGYLFHFISKAMPLEILKTILYGYNFTVVQVLYKHFHLPTEEIQSRTQLTRKQVYTAIERLKAVDAIAKNDSNEYVLTQITIDILKHINAIEEIEAKRVDYKAKEIIESDKKTTEEEKQEIFKDLKL